MGRSVTKAAADTRDRILAALCIGKPSNVYAVDLGEPCRMHGFPHDEVSQVKVFHFEEDTEEQPNCEIRGVVYLHVPPNNATPFAEVVIDEDGNLVSAPLMWHQSVSESPDLRNAVRGMLVNVDTLPDYQ